MSTHPTAENWQASSNVTSQVSRIQCSTFGWSDFFGTAGFAALHNVNVISSQYGVSWALLAGRQVRRLLAICDPDDTLPLEDPQSILDDLDTGVSDRKLLVGGNHQHRGRRLLR